MAATKALLLLCTSLLASADPLDSVNSTNKEPSQASLSELAAELAPQCDAWERSLGALEQEEISHEPDIRVGTAVEAANLIYAEGGNADDFETWFNQACPSIHFIDAESVYSSYLRADLDGFEDDARGVADVQKRTVAGIELVGSRNKIREAPTAPARAAVSKSPSTDGPVCTSTQPAKLRARTIAERTTYNPPDCKETQEIVSELQYYPDSRGALVNTLKNSPSNYIRDLSPLANTCVFYVGPNGSDFANAMTKYGFNTVATVYYGYNQGPFDSEIQPFSTIVGLDTDYRNDNLRTAWFKVTSYAYASLCKGYTYLIYDGDASKSVGRTGNPSIFRTDELPALKADSSVSKVYQITFADSYKAIVDKWTPTQLYNQINSGNIKPIASLK